MERTLLSDGGMDGSGTVGLAARRALGMREIGLVAAVALTGMFLRVTLALCSRGTNDIVSWEGFAEQAEQHGVVWMYQNVPKWNHPPLMGGMLLGLGAISETLGLGFAPVFKLVPILADLASALLIFGVWFRRTGDFPRSLRALAVFSLSLNALLVSAYHGNTDPLVGALVLAACVGVERQRYGWAGVLLGAAVNVKLIPVLVIPLLVARANLRQVVRFSAGAALGVLPFLPILWMSGAGFARNALAYRSNFDNFGIPLVIRTPWFIARARGHTTVQHALEGVRDVYIAAGGYLVIAAVLWLAWRTRFVKDLPVFERVALGLATFLVLGPGFGVQYTAILGPVLLAASLGWGLRWAVLAGVFLGVAYLDYWTGTFPLHSHFYSTLRIPASIVGVAVWVLLVLFIRERLFRVAHPRRTFEHVRAPVQVLSRRAQPPEPALPFGAPGPRISSE